MLVDIAGKDLLAAARLPADEHAGVQRGHAVGNGEHLLQLLTLGHDAVRMGRRGQLGLARAFIKNVGLLQQGLIQVLKILHVLQHGDDILDAAGAVEQRRSGDDAHTGGAVGLLAILVILQTADRLLLLLHQVVDAHVDKAVEVPHVHLQIFVSGDVPPVDHHPVDKDEVPVPVVHYDPHVDVVQHLAEGQLAPVRPVRRGLPLFHGRRLPSCRGQTAAGVCLLYHIPPAKESPLRKKAARTAIWNREARPPEDIRRAGRSHF